MKSIITTLFTSSLFSLFANAHNIQLQPHSRECFHESLHKDDRMTVSFQVGDREFGGAGNLDVDFWVRDFVVLSFCAVSCVYSSFGLGVSRIWLLEL